MVEGVVVYAFEALAIVVTISLLIGIVVCRLIFVRLRDIEDRLISRRKELDLFWRCFTFDQDASSRQSGATSNENRPD